MSTAAYQPTPHIVAFVDALGFSKEVGREENDQVDRFFKTVERAKNHWQRREGKGAALKVTTIGDSVILAMEAHGQEDERGCLIGDELFLPKLYNLLYAVAELQCGLGLMNIWTRGSVTFDMLQFSEHRIVGPAFHRAYFLESNVAKFPRVILDGSLVFASGCSTTQELVDAMKPLGRPILYDYGKADLNRYTLPHDIPTFVNFAALINEVHSAGVHSITRIAEHISQRLKGSVEHFAKYRWLANYFSNHLESTPTIRALLDNKSLNEARMRLRDNWT